MQLKIKKVLNGWAGGKQFVSVIVNGKEIGYIQPTHLVHIGSTGTYFVSLQMQGEYEVKIHDTFLDALLALGVTSKELDEYLQYNTLPSGCFEEFYRRVF